MSALLSDQPVSLSSLTRAATGPVSLPVLASAPCSLSSPEGGPSLDARRKGQRDPHYPGVCPTDTSVCAQGVKASCLHSCLRLGPPQTPPSPILSAVSRGQVPWTRLNSRKETLGGEGGIGRRGGWAHLSVVTLLCSNLVKGESLPTSSSP